MGKQAGPLKITGTFDGLSFYKMGDEYYVRKKGGPTRKQVLKSPSFENTRRVISEFTKCSQDAGLLRRAIRQLVKLDTSYHRRLNKVMLAIKNFDRTSAWGQRYIHKALKTAEARSALLQFDFIKGRKPSQNLANKISISKDKEFRISGFSLQDLCFPNDAHLLLLTAGQVSLDFENCKSEVTAYQSILIDKKTKIKDILLQPLKKSKSLGDDIFILHIQFFTKSGKEYIPCTSGSEDVLSIVAINPSSRTIAPKKEIPKKALLVTEITKYISKPLDFSFLLKSLPKENSLLPAPG